MTKIITAAILLIMSASSINTFAGNVKLTVNEGVKSSKLRQTIEQQVSNLLSNINEAQTSNLSRVDFSRINIIDDAKDDVQRIWNTEHFMCPQSEVVERVLTLRNGYQVRNIPLVIFHDGEENTYQEAVINFDKKGVIIGFSFTIDAELFSKVMQERMQNPNHEVTDINNRMQIINFVEQFRTAYDKKDINFLQEIFSDDALIITGRVVQRKGNEVIPSGTDIQYFKQTKKEYLGRLQQTFNNAKYIKVKFDDLKIVQHPTKRGVYGVTVLQQWNSNRYSDEGYVFMMWDFRNPKKPQIHVRTWQPKYIDKKLGKKLNPNDVFTLGSFDL